MGFESGIINIMRSRFIGTYSKHKKIRAALNITDDYQRAILKRNIFLRYLFDFVRRDKITNTLVFFHLGKRN